MTGLADVRRGLADEGLRLVRSWPRAAGHLLLHLEPAHVPADAPDRGPTWLAGQWFADRAEAVATARRAPGAQAVALPYGAAVLQPGGADHRLAALPGLLGDPTARLVAHRPGRRAVVAHDDRDGRSLFTKVVPASRLAALARTASWRPDGVDVPAVLAVDPVGTVTTAALPGTGLHALGRSEGRRTDDLRSGTPRGDGAAWRAAGAAVAALHRSPPPTHARPHGLADELGVTLGWLRRAGEHGALDPARVEHLTGLVAEAAARDELVRHGAWATLHRDLHEGQVVVAGDGRAALLDLDLVAVGDPALDVANLLVHLRLRDEQARLAGDVGPPRAPARAAAFLAGYGPGPDPSRLQGLAVLAAARVAAVYAFRAPAGEARATAAGATGAPTDDVGGVEVGDRLVRAVTGGVC